MIVAKAGPVLIVGINAQNVENLKSDKPLIIPVGQYGPGVKEVAVIYGETYRDLVEQLVEAGVMDPKALNDYKDAEFGETRVWRG